MNITSAIDELSKEARIGEIASVRTKIRANLALHIELLAAITKTLREHGITPNEQIVGDLTLALSDEITQELDTLVDLPGGAAPVGGGPC